MDVTSISTNLQNTSPSSTQNYLKRKSPIFSLINISKHGQITATVNFSSHITSISLILSFHTPPSRSKSIGHTKPRCDKTPDLHIHPPLKFDVIAVIENMMIPNYIIENMMIPNYIIENMMIPNYIIKNMMIPNYIIENMMIPNYILQISLTSNLSLSRLARFIML